MKFMKDGTTILTKLVQNFNIDTIDSTVLLHSLADLEKLVSEELKLLAIMMLPILPAQSHLVLVAKHQSSYLAKLPTVMLKLLN